MHVCRQTYSITSDTAGTVLSFNNAHQIMRYVDSLDSVLGNIVSLLCIKNSSNFSFHLYNKFFNLSWIFLIVCSLTQKRIIVFNVQQTFWFSKTFNFLLFKKSEKKKTKMVSRVNLFKISVSRIFEIIPFLFFKFFSIFE